jgi:hypothetical protein
VVEEEVVQEQLHMVLAVQVVTVAVVQEEQAILQ